MEKEMFESRTTAHLDSGVRFVENACSIYFRIPLTGYFVGRDFDSIEGGSKLYLYRKEWDGQGYYFAKV